MPYALLELSHRPTSNINAPVCLMPYIAVCLMPYALYSVKAPTPSNIQHLYNINAPSMPDTESLFPATSVGCVSVFLAFFVGGEVDCAFI